ncbi:MAG: protein kinase [Myxococcales bacterium]|nr:protein kinase [Myxococcales bacterium]
MSSAPSDVLRAELERLFDLESLQKLSSELLDLDPNDVGGTTSKAAFARALVDRCSREEMLEALADAIVLKDRDAAPRVRVVYDGRADDLQPGATVAGFRIQKKINDEGFGSVFMANADGKQVTLKVLRETKVRDRKGLQRFLLAQRALKRVDHPAVVKVLAAGVLPDGRPYLASEHIDGQLLSVRLGRTGAMHLNEARALLESIAAGLDAAHAVGIMHSDLRPEHVMIVRREGQLNGVLVDFAVDRMTGSREGGLDSSSLLVLVGSARNIAPERARSGAAADVRSDVYAFGCLAYEVLTGKAPFAGATPIDQIVAHVSQVAEAPSKVAPRGWVSKDLDPVFAQVLSKTPAERFASAGEFVRALSDAAAGKRLADVTREEFDARKAAVLAAPADDDKALALEACGGRGVPWADVLAALEEVIAKADNDSAKKALLFRAARVAQIETKDLAKARALYEEIHKLDEKDEIVLAKIVEIRRAMATPEEKAELLLEEADQEKLADKKAELYHELAKVYEVELKDSENALVAASEAVSSAPHVDEYAREIERLAGSDVARWNEVLTTLSQSAQGRDPSEGSRLYVLLGGWYADKLSRPDYAANCYSQALALEPNNDQALDGAANIYRKAQQWPELVAVLLKRADAQGSPIRARDYRAEAADIIEARVGDDKRAREIAEKVLADDPAQAKALQVLERIYISQDDYKSLVSLLEKKSEALTGAARSEALCEIAETWEDRLKDDTKAADFYEKARAEDGKNITALKGLERLYARTGQNEKLLHVLEAQIGVAATPRQKIELYNRVAAIYEEEFVDHAKATASFESVLAIDQSNDPALTGLARLYRVTRHWEQLVDLLDRHAQIVESSTRKADLHAQRGRVLLDPIGSIDRASEAFEKALEADGTNNAALEGAAKVRALKGDVKAAAQALDMLAAQAKTPQEKAEAFVRAGKILEDKHDLDGAIERYKRALDAVDDYGPATARLRDLYASRGDAQGAIEILQREIEAADGTNQRAKLWTEVAKIYRDRVESPAKAMEAAQKAVLLDSTNEDASTMLGELKFDAGEFAEAAKLLAQRAGRVKELGKEEGVRVALKYGQALAKSGDEAAALDAFAKARELAPGDRSVQKSAADAAFAIGRYEQARKDYEALVLTHGKEMERPERAQVLTNLGRAASKLGDAAAAVRVLNEAVELDPASIDAADSLADAYGQQGKWEEVARVRRQKAEHAPADKRYDLYIELGELYATKLSDKAQAARAFMSALEARPDDRRLLMKLVQLYSEGQDWSRLVEVILRLADLVDDRSQLAKYYLTAAQLCAQQLNRPDEGASYYERALEYDPTSIRALEGLAEVRVARKEFSLLESAAKKALSKLTGDGAKTAQARGYAALGDAIASQADKTDDAISSYEKAQELDPSLELTDKLAALYLREPKKHIDKAIRAQKAVVAKDPTRGEHYRVLRKLYTTARKPDEAWCLCQALAALKAAEPDEEGFFKKFRSDAAAAANDKVSEDLWSRSLAHPTQDPLLTGIFTTILPALLATRAEKREAYGVTESQIIDASAHGSAMARTIHYAAGTLGLKNPPVYVNEADDSGLNVMLTSPPSFVLGRAALGGGPAQALAFIVGSKMAYFRGGHFVRQLVPTGTGLRAWLFAAIRTVNPAFPIAPELMGAVQENGAAIKQHVTGPSYEHLTSLVTKLLNLDNALDLKRWTTAVDLTSDRVGFVLANDLPRALAVIRATPEDQSPLPAKDRTRELIAFAVSDEYFYLRQKLGIAIQAGG